MRHSIRSKRILKTLALRGVGPRRQHEFDLLAPAVHVLFLYCDLRGALRAAIDLFAAVATELSAELEAAAYTQPVPRELWGRLTACLGAGEVLLGNYARGENYLLDCLPYLQADKERAFALAYLGQAAAESGELVLARTRLDESLAISRQCNDFAGMAHALQVLEVGRPFVEAQRLAAESLACARKAGRPDLIASRLNQFGWHTWCLGDYATADACWREGITLCEQLGLRGENAWPLDCLGLAAWFQGDMETAERDIGEALAIYSEAGRQFAIGMCKAELAMVLASTRRFPQAIAMAREAVAITRGVNGQMMLIVSLSHLGTVLGASGELEEARRTLHEAVRRAWDCQYLFSLMMAFYAYAELLVSESHSAGLPGSREHLGLAATLLSCVCTQPAAWQAYKDKAAQLLTLIESALPAAVFSAAIQAGRSKTVEAARRHAAGEQCVKRSQMPHSEPQQGTVRCRASDASSALFERLDGTRTSRPAPDRRRSIQPGHCGRTRHHAGHGQVVCQPDPRQAGRAEPHAGGCPRPGTRAAGLTCSNIMYLSAAAVPPADTAGLCAQRRAAGSSRSTAAQSAGRAAPSQESSRVHLRPTAEAAARRLLCWRQWPPYRRCGHTPCAARAGRVWR